jgi:hypothetical protein
MIRPRTVPHRYTVKHAVANGGQVHWMEPVTDEQYGGKTG